MKKFLCLVCCSLFIMTGCGQTSYFQSTESEEVQSDKEVVETESISENESSVIYVQVAGAVNSPGVYELKQGSRVYVAIEAADGLSDLADDSDINQAALLEDGQKIYIYTTEEREKLAQIEAETEADDGLVNINTATAGELTTLPGIGEAKATQIIAYREANGNFSSIDDIKNVSGIGDGIFNQINSLIKI